MRTSLLATSMLAVTLASGCAEPVGTPSDGRAAAPIPSFLNGPDIGNIRIARYETHWGVSWTDPATGLRATHTTFPIGNEPDCGLQAALDPIAAQDVGLIEDPLFSSQIRTMAAGEVWIMVRDLSEPGDCYGNALVAQGLGRLRYVDNDAFSVGPEGHNANTWGFTASGSLTAPGGGTMQYSGHARYLVRPDGAFSPQSLLVNVQ